MQKEQLPPKQSVFLKVVPPPKTGPLSPLRRGHQGALLIREASHSLKNAVHDCEVFRLLSSRSMVRIHQGASTTKPLQRIRLGMVQTGCGAPRSVRGTDQIKRSAVGLGDEGASLLI